MAEAGPLDELPASRADVLRGQATFVSGLGSSTPPLLFKAAKRLEQLDLGLARETYLSAWMAAMFAGRLAGAGDLLEVSRAARALPAAADTSAPGRPDPGRPGPAGYRRTGRRRTGVAARGERLYRPRHLRGRRTAVESSHQAASSALWDDDAWRAMLVRHVRLARDAGALDQLPIMLGALGTAAVWSGGFAAAVSLIAEADAVCEATGSCAAPFAAMLLASLRGDQAEAAPLIEATIARAAAGGQGIAVACAHWVAAILANGLGRYEEALAAARHASEDTFTLHISMWALPELVEAAARRGNTEVAAGALERLAETTQAGGTDFGLGLEARCRALLSGGAAADELHREAIDRLGRTRLRPELARAPAVRGMVAPQGRRVNARGQLRTAHDMLDAIGMEAFAERARHELMATGEKVRKRSTRRATSSRRRRSRSRGWPATAAPARRWAPGCLPVRSHGRMAPRRCSPSSASARAANCATRWPPRDSRASRPSRRSQRPVACPADSFARSCPGAAANATAAGGTLRGEFARARGLPGPDVREGLLRCSGQKVGGHGDQVLHG